MKNNNLNILSFAVIGMFLIALSGCSKDDKPQPYVEVTTTIGGEDFTPTNSVVTKYNDRLKFEFSQGGKKLMIVTKDTIEGTYEIQQQSFKSGGYIATIDFYDRTVDYNGFNGTVTITLEKHGTLTIDYEAKLQDALNNMIELKNGYNSINQSDIEDRTSSIPGGTPDCIFNSSIDYGLLTDQQGNVYRTITLGTQTWMAENLRATAYADGTTIPHITDNEKWIALENDNTDRAYCWYNNERMLLMMAMVRYIPTLPQ